MRHSSCPLGRRDSLGAWRHSSTAPAVRHALLRAQAQHRATHTDRLRRAPAGKRPSELAHSDSSQSDLFGSASPKVFDGKGVSHYLACANAGEFQRSANR